MALITVISRVAHTSPDQRYREGGAEYDCEEADRPTRWADLKPSEIVQEIVPDVPPPA